MSVNENTSLEWYAKKILPDAQVRKFRYRQDLLARELERESEFPEIQNVLSDIFISVKEKNYRKYIIAHKQLANRIDEDTLRQSIRYSIASKKEPLSKREVYVLHLLTEGKSLMEVF